MPQPPKDKPCRDVDESGEPVDDGSWESDQRRHEYYYDDAHGYEAFVDDDEDEDENAETDVGLAGLRVRES